MKQPPSELGPIAPQITARMHPLRDAVLAEVHARPFETLSAPLRVSHLALLSGTEAAAAAEERAHLATLCRRFELAGPGPESSHFSAEFGEFRLRWERHQEFSTYTFYRYGSSAASFDDPAVAVVPPDWLHELPGELLAAVHLVLQHRDSASTEPGEIESTFGTEVFAGSAVADGAAVVWSDFRPHHDGYCRVLVQDRSLAPRRAGRLVQRLLEIETYRLMALLAFPLAREAGPQLTRMETWLEQLTERLTESDNAEAEQALLAELSELASQVERLNARTNFRLSAARAYHDLVSRRIENLREERLGDLQTLGKFMERRLTPAMRTCESVCARQEALARRVARAANLLRTRVDVALEAQNRDLLASMNRRAHMQLRLQQTVEGLSVVVLSYYTVGLLGYLIKAAKAAGLPVVVDLGVGLAVPAVILGMWLSLRSLRRRLHG